MKFWEKVATYVHVELVTYKNLLWFFAFSLKNSIANFLNLEEDSS